MKILTKEILSNSNIRLILVTFIIGPLSFGLFAQGIPYGNSTGSGSNVSWNDTQNGRVAWFQAPLTGYLTQVVFNSNQPSQTGELGVYDDQISACGNTPSLLASSQTITPVVGLNTVIFNPPILLTNGVTYYFWPNSANWAMDWSSVGDILETGTFYGNNCTDQTGDMYMQFFMQCFVNGTDTRTECTEYTWIDGKTYTSDTIGAMHTISGGAANGCDSVVTLNLTISSVSDITTSTSGVTVSANNPGATYQWLDCDNSYAIISGETNQSYTATSNGNYAVELTENGCVDTTSCVGITTVGIIENNFGNELTVYPNPTNGAFSIDLGYNHNSILVKMTDLNGNLIKSKEYNNTNLLNLRIDEPNGVYLLIIESAKNIAIIKLIKE